MGTVCPQYCERAAGQSVAQPGSVFTDHQCQLLTNAGLTGATTFQLAYNPNNGGDETLCIGGWANEVSNGWKLRLTPCGVAADTVLIQTATLPGGSDQHRRLADQRRERQLLDPARRHRILAIAPSQPTWSTVVLNGKKGIDTQETHFLPGPF